VYFTGLKELFRISIIHILIIYTKVFFTG